MQKRTWHYLGPSKLVPFPRVVLTLAAESSLSPVGAHGKAGSDALDWWSSLSLTLSGSGHGPAAAACGLSAGEWWTWLKSHLRRRATVWVVGWRMHWLCTLLGVWQGIETGELQLVGWPALSGSADRGKPPANGQSPVLIGTPPFHLHLRLFGQGGSVKFLDLENYGLKPAPDMAGAGDMAHAAARSFSLYLNLLQENGWGGPRLTAAAQAWHLFRRNYIRGPILVHNNVDALSLERAGLFAGRCQIFGGPARVSSVYELDIKGAYPSLCLGAGLPARFRGHAARGGRVLRAALAAGYCVVARVTLSTDRDCYPRQGPTGLLYSPGCFNTCLYGPELSRALDRGEVVEVGECAWYEPSQALDTCQRRWLDLRSGSQGTDAGERRAVLKTFANSLIGKLAARNFAWQPCPTSPHPFFWDRWTEQCSEVQRPLPHRSIGPYCQHERDLGEHPESCPALAGWIYSLCRCRLADLLDVAGRENVYYVDTDSLWTNEAGYVALDRPRPSAECQPGELGLKAIHDVVHFLSKKHYLAGGVLTRAGVPSLANVAIDGSVRWRSPETPQEAIGLRRPPGLQQRERVIHGAR